MGNPVQSDKDADKANKLLVKFVLFLVAVGVFALLFLFFNQERTTYTKVDESAPVQNKSLSSDDAFYRAKGLQDRGEYAKASKLFTKAIRIKRERPKEGLVDLPTILAWAAQNATQNKDLSEAIILFKQAIELQHESLGPKHQFIAMNMISLASAYHDQGNYDLALDELEKAFKMDSVLSDRLRSDIHYWMGDNYQHKEDYQKAILNLKASIGIRKNFRDKEPLVSAMRKYASVLRNLKKEDEADKIEKEAQFLMGASTSEEQK